MELLFRISEDWKLHLVPKSVQQYDNLTDSIRITGYLPSDFSQYKALISYQQNYDEIPLYADEDGISAVLTANQLSFNGAYEIQIRAEDGERVKHTNVIVFAVNRSLSGDAVWPVLPTVFSEAVRRAEEAAREAEEATSGKIDKSAQSTKTDIMTQPVGIDSNGKLWTQPGGGGSVDLGLSVVNGELCVTYEET